MSVRKLVFLDTETTGLSPNQGDRIIEIGCLEILDREITEKKFQVYLNPERSNSQRSIEITGLTDDFLADKPKFADIFEEFARFIEHSEIIIHNARFDESFLNAEFSRLDPNLTLRQLGSVTCSLQMARLKRPGQKNSLDALCRAYRIDNQHRKYHGALLDAELTARVYLAMTAGQVSLPLFQNTAGSGTRASPSLSATTPVSISHDTPLQLVQVVATEPERQEHDAWFA